MEEHGWCVECIPMALRRNIALIGKLKFEDDSRSQEKFVGTVN